MDKEEIFVNLKQLGRSNSKRQHLKEYCKQNCDKIIKCLPQQILHSDGADVLDCLFNGISEECITSNRIKIKVIDIVLKAFRTEASSSTHCNNVISRLCLELPQCNADDLVLWSNESVHTILMDDDVNMIWRDILPVCLNALSSHSHVKHCGTQMTSDEYSEQCVTTLCQCHWKERQLVQLTAMFKDMQLTRDVHKQVVNKICSYLNDVPIESIPPLLHQLLKLCKVQHIDIVLAYLSEYFKTRLYSKIDPPDNDSEGTTIDLDEIATDSQEELSRCLSTCLYHITQGAADPEFITKRLKLWPTSQILRNPFLIDIALALADKGLDFKSTCLGVIKDSIEQRELISMRSKQSCWLREVLPNDVNVATVLKILTTESANHRSLTVSGLIALGFVLLATPRIKPVASACWSHARLILVRLAKTQPETAAHILSQLADKDLNLKQYSDLLYFLCKLSPVSVEKCSQLTLLLESVHPSPTQGYVPAARVLDAYHPLLGFSTKVRDYMLMLCRKKLYSRDASDRCIAVSGFLTLLRHIKLPNSNNISNQTQDQFSAQSIFTQLTIELHATQSGAPATSRVRNESMCLEVISIMRRCLMQDAAVKQLFYSEIFECIQQKSSLHESILESLYEHLYQYLSEDDHGSPILWNKCVNNSATDAILTEPIGYLIYGLSKFVQGEEEGDLEDILSGYLDNPATGLKNKLNDIFEKITTRDLVMDVETEYIGLTASSPESKTKYIILQQILHCYEALIAYHIKRCTQTSKNNYNNVLKLYKAYNHLLEFAKASPKGNKKASKSHLNETARSTQCSARDKTTASNKSKKDKIFKPLPCLWNLEFCYKIIELLYSENVTWCDTEYRNTLRSKYEFHLFVIHNVQSVVNEKEIPKNDATSFGINICKILYKRCIVRFDNVNDFNEKVALACIELFKDCLTLLLCSNYAIKVDKLLPTITETPEKEVSQSMAAILESVYKALESINTLSTSQPIANDVMSRKLNAALSHVAATILNIPIDCSCPKLSAVIAEVEKFIKTTNIDISILLPPLLSVSARDQQDVAILDLLFEKLKSALGPIEQEESAEEPENCTFPYIDARTGHTVLAQICSHLALTHQTIVLQVKYCQQLVSALQHSTPQTTHKFDKEIKDINKNLVIQLCQLCKYTRMAGSLRCTVGAGTDRVLSAFIRLYTVLRDFVKHLGTCVTKDDVSQLHNIRLERLMKQSGKPLCSCMDSVVEYLARWEPTSKAAPHSVLRDTKLVPRLVLRAETYKRDVLVLANVTKIDYQHYMPVGSARDFKIRAPLLAEALENIQELESEEMDVTEAEADIQSDNSHNKENEDLSPPQPKRTRK